MSKISIWLFVVVSLICFQFINAEAEVFVIPIGSINIDGDITDWNSIQPAFVDAVDDQNPNSDFDGTDIEELYLAKDSIFLYLMIKLYDGNPKTDMVTQYNFQLNQDNSQADTVGDRYISAIFRNGSWGVYVNERDDTPPPTQLFAYTSDYVGVGNKFIEYKAPLSDLGEIENKYIRIYSHVTNPSYPVSDGNTTDIQLTSCLNIVISALQIISGITPSVNINSTDDINFDDRIGLEEAILFIQKAAEIRP